MGRWSHKCWDSKLQIWSWIYNQTTIAFSGFVLLVEGSNVIDYNSAHCTRELKALPRIRHIKHLKGFGLPWEHKTIFPVPSPTSADQLHGSRLVHLWKLHSGPPLPTALCAHGHYDGPPHVAKHRCKLNVQKVIPRHNTAIFYYHLWKNAQKTEENSCSKMLMPCSFCQPMRVLMRVQNHGQGPFWIQYICVSFFFVERQQVNPELQSGKKTARFRQNIQHVIKQCDACRLSGPITITHIFKG